MLRKLIIGIATLVVILVVAGYIISSGVLGQRQGPGEITLIETPSKVTTEREQAQEDTARALGETADKQILFGDLHVHTTFSLDAFMQNLPIMQGEGTHPPADACDFARFCSALDFWSINDHAEQISQSAWLDTKESIRQCNAVTNPDNPDSVAFLGFEWTQRGNSPNNHYGHKNVIYRDIDDDKVPTRPIGALSLVKGTASLPLPLAQRLGFGLLDPANIQIYMDYNKFNNEFRSVEKCPDNVNVKDLPTDCMEFAKTPVDLFDKLDQWGFDSIVVPHGNSWGLYTPPGSSWDKQLKGKMHDPAKQRLIEIFSGHGNAEEYRPWRAVGYDDNGNIYCPDSTEKYTPGCQRAGEIIFERCKNVGESDLECNKRAETAKLDYLKTGRSAFMAIPGTEQEDWEDSEQCIDCFLPPFGHRPMASTQYALAIGDFSDPAKPQRFRFGFIGSSDNHNARGGTGYKEFDRRAMTESQGTSGPKWRDMLVKQEDPVPYSRIWSSEKYGGGAMSSVMGAERMASYFYTGGLVAVHSENRTRDAIWAAMKRKEVYATSGERILLWFDLLNGGETGNEVLPMGAETEMKRSPRFRVRAAGSFKQKPGCPDYSVASLTPERLKNVCRNECYNPSGERKLITRIEVIRIRPQSYENEPVDNLIEDVWKQFECPKDPAGCMVDFEDPEFDTVRRDTLYYVRAIEEATPTINGKQYRIEYDDNGKVKKINPCYSGYRGENDECLSNAEPRAWSSPIFVDYK